MIINDLTIALMVLIGIRFIACVMFTILFFQHLKVRYLVLSLGWFIYMLGPFPDLFGSAAEIYILSPFFGFTATIATFFLMMAVILCFRDIPLKVLIPVLISVAAVIGLMVAIDSETIGLMAVFTQGAFLLSVLVLVIINGKFLKSSKSNVSFFWLCATLVFGLFHALGFSLLFGKAPLSVRFVFTFLINVSLLEYFIYLDWEQSFKKLEDSDARYRFLFNTAPVALFEEDSEGIKEYISEFEAKGVVDIQDYLREHPEDAENILPEMKILEVNNKALSLFQAESRKELIENIGDFFHPETYRSMTQAMMEMANNNGYSTFETIIWTTKGEQKEVLVSCYYPERKSLNKKTIISMTDVTEKNEARKELEASLREKEILLQEVHHRVKNNLAIISSILGLQSSSIDDPKMKDLIQSIENRISTMAIVHDQLYTSRDLKDIDVADYIRQLTDGLHMNLYNEEKPVRIVLEIIPVRFSLNLLIPLGMLINEIVSNSFRHAFEKVSDPEIRICLSSDNTYHYILSISDNGGGFSDEYTSKDVETTGFIIINALAHQIGAELSVISENGTEFKLILPHF